MLHLINATQKLKYVLCCKTQFKVSNNSVIPELC